MTKETMKNFLMLFLVFSLGFVSSASAAKEATDDSSVEITEKAVIKIISYSIKTQEFTFSIVGESAVDELVVNRKQLSELVHSEVAKAIHLTPQSLVGKKLVLKKSFSGRLKE